MGVQDHVHVHVLAKEAMIWGKNNYHSNVTMSLLLSLS